MSQAKLKRYFQFLLVVLAAGAIYPVIYLRTNYQETILQVFNMTLPQLNTLYSLMGLVFVFGYIPSGYLSDRFSAKMLLTISLLGTAVGGFWYAQVPSYTYVSIIFVIWGFFSVFTFWSSHLKIVKMIASDKEQGRFFGILDGGRGVVEAVLASLALIIFSTVLGNSLSLVDKTTALTSVIYMYSIVLAATGLLIYFFVEDDKKMLKTAGKTKNDVAEQRFKFSDLKKLLQNKLVYLHGAIIFMGYAVFWTVYYIGGFLESNIGLDPVTVGLITVIILWMRPVGGIIGGFLADKFGRTVVQMVVLAGAAVVLAIIAILPATSGNFIFYALAVVLGIFLYAIRGTYWSLLGDAKIEAFIMGTAIGFISFIGYLPDIILPQFNSLLFNTFGGNGGYNAYFISSAIIGLVGVVLVYVFRKLTVK
jgi:MFS family permease